MTGVSADVAKQAEALDANVLTETNLLLRECEHGVRHPVGKLGDPSFDPTHPDNIKLHERRGPHFGGRLPADCCGCCLQPVAKE